MITKCNTKFGKFPGIYCVANHFIRCVYGCVLSLWFFKRGIDMYTRYQHVKSYVIQYCIESVYYSSRYFLKLYTRILATLVSGYMCVRQSDSCSGLIKQVNMSSSLIYGIVNVPKKITNLINLQFFRSII